MGIFLIGLPLSRWRRLILGPVHPLRYVVVKLESSVTIEVVFVITGGSFTAEVFVLLALVLFGFVLGPFLLAGLLARFLLYSLFNSIIAAAAAT